jgi:hypothetical protein
MATDEHRWPSSHRSAPNRQKQVRVRQRGDGEAHGFKVRAEPGMRFIHLEYVYAASLEQQNSERFRTLERPP